MSLPDFHFIVHHSSFIISSEAFLIAHIFKQLANLILYNPQGVTSAIRPLDFSPILLYI